MTTDQGRGRLDALRIGRGVGPGDTLRTALAGVLAAWGCEVDDALLSVTLADAFMLTHAAEVEGLSQWNIHGRHAFLAEAACDLGLSLYDLHPPEAAPLPSPPPEFATHFRDSYAPFVAAAIERDDATLAWMGWPPPHKQAWGVVTGMLDGGRCVGRTMYSGAETIEMVGPPVLVYIVNGVTPGNIDPAPLIGRILPRAAVVLNNRLDERFGVSTGTAALEAWRAAVQSVVACGADSAAGEYHATIARQLVAGRKVARRFFTEYRSGVEQHEAAAMQVCCEAFSEMIERLTPFAQPGDCVEATMAEHLEGLSGAIEGVLPFEQQAAMALTGWIEE